MVIEMELVNIIGVLRGNRLHNVSRLVTGFIDSDSKMLNFKNN